MLPEGKFQVGKLELSFNMFLKECNMAALSHTNSIFYEVYGWIISLGYVDWLYMRILYVIRLV